ncbi:forkhead box transcription factor [Aspergillus candidus]|uniref:Fork-head domain-containing protein n=1 Tax=Aspergillus candidus TaxID=41067 RepID=A0A2I2EXK4_ASPCN|nr:hypothetical protein BDW47DRAFT_130739 [Aspergillus candidus]PLB33115.1 hypothetical protein BDW47DRAFT_130739 [Aspergillus candidus]
MDRFVPHGLPTTSVPARRINPQRFIPKQTETPCSLADGALPQTSRSHNPCSTVDNWTRSSSSSPEAMMSCQQHPWSMEANTSEYILSPSHSPKDTLADVLSGQYVHDSEYSDWSSSLMNPNPTHAPSSHARRQPSPEWRQELHATGLVGVDRDSYGASFRSHQQRSGMAATAYPSVPPSPLLSSSGYPPSQYGRPDLSPLKPLVEHDDSRTSPDDTEEDGSADPPYSLLIYQALWSAAGRKLTLQDIYSWFEKNTTKGKDRTSKGWQNSIRHNLSMNAGFEAVREEPTPGKKAVNYWRLTEEAFANGIQSTTRYRKQANYKKALGSDPPAPQRQRSGAKGGKATKITAKFRGQLSQDESRRERYRPRLASSSTSSSSPRGHDLKDLYGQYHLPSAMPMVVPYHVAACPTAPMNRSTASSGGHHFDLGSVVGCADTPPCAPVFCDMAGPSGADCLALDPGYMGWCGSNLPHRFSHAHHGMLTGSEPSSTDLPLGV